MSEWRAAGGGIADFPPKAERPHNINARELGLFQSGGNEQLIVNVFTPLEYMAARRSERPGLSE